MKLFFESRIKTLLNKFLILRDIIILLAYFYLAKRENINILKEDVNISKRSIYLLLLKNN